jgi:glycosyltransferase involved in cell wall biosynthesis
MHILFALDNGGIGGAEKFVVRLAEKAVENSHKADILILGKDRRITEFTSNQQIYFFFAQRRFKLDVWNFIGQIRVILKECRADVIVVNGLLSYFFISATSRLFRIKNPVLLVFHETLPFRFFDYIWWVFYIISMHIFGGIWVILYPRYKHILAKRFLLDTNDIRSMPPGIDTAFYSKEFYFSTQPAGQKDAFIIAHIANLKPLKDQKTLFMGLKVFNDKTKAKWRLLIAGSGGRGTLKEYKGLLKKLGIDKNIVFLGLIKDVRSALAEADIFILSSRVETFPQSALEALSMGVPAILPRVGGCIDIIKEGVNGYLFKPGDYAGLGNLLTSVYSDNGLLIRLKEQSRKTVLERFDILYTTETLINICRDELLRK